MAIITYPLNQIEYTAENAETYLCTRTTGVYSAEDNLAVKRSKVNPMKSVTVTQGLAWIKDGEFSGKSVCVTEEVTLNVPYQINEYNFAAVCLRYDKGKNATELVFENIVSSNEYIPLSAALPEAYKIIKRDNFTYDLYLALVEVSFVAGSQEILDIFDMRLDENVCGIMRDGVEGIPTQDLLEEAYKAIEGIGIVKSGDGENSLVLVDGNATGDYSIASGGADQELFEKISKYLGGGSITAEPAEASGDLSEAYGANTKAVSIGSLGFGFNVSSGCKGFYFTEINGSTLTLSISNSETVWDENARDMLFKWIAGDEVTINNNSKYAFCAKIKYISNSYIRASVTFDSLPFTELYSDAENDIDHIVFVPTKPTAGVVDTAYAPTAFGFNNKSSGSAAFTAGRDNVVGSDYGAAVGRQNKVGYGSFASGWGNDAHHRYNLSGGYYNASGDNYTFTAGYHNHALGSTSTAVGYQQTCVGGHSNSEGYSGAIASAQVAGLTSSTLISTIKNAWNKVKFSLAKGNYSHVEGRDNLAIGLGSHVEGRTNVAEGDYSHAEGNKTTAGGENAHAEGYNTFANGYASNSIGYGTTVTKSFGHAEGYSNAYAMTQISGLDMNTNASTVESAWKKTPFTLVHANYGHAEGRDTLVLGLGGHAEGLQNEAKGNYSHVSGRNNVAGYEAQCVVGKYNKNNADTLFEVGNGTSDSNRSTAFWVKKDGTTSLDAKIAQAGGGGGAVEYEVGEVDEGEYSAYYFRYGRIVQVYTPETIGNFLGNINLPYPASTSYKYSTQLQQASTIGYCISSSQYNTRDYKPWTIKLTSQTTALPNSGSSAAGELSDWIDGYVITYFTDAPMNTD